MRKMAYAKLVGDWERLLAAAEQHAGAAAEFQPYLDAFRHQIAELQRLKAEQESARAIRQQRTQDINRSIGEGQAMAMRLRGLVKARIGPYNERLVQFGMVPLRPRQNRIAGEAGKPPALAPASPAPEPEAGGEAARAVPPEGGGDVN